MNSSTYSSKVCSPRHAPALDNLFRRLLQSPKKIVGPYIKEGCVIIDLGCGPGFFTIPMAEMVGPTGTVVGVDLQEKMLDILAEKLFDTELASRVKLHRCREDTLDLPPTLKANFILAYYMVHEVEDQSRLFSEIYDHLLPGGTCLIVEPPFHVSRKAFRGMLDLIEDSGLRILDRPKRKGGMSVLLSR